MLGRNKVRLCIFLIISVSSETARAQINKLDAVRNVTHSLNQFGIILLRETTSALGDSRNLAISPFAAWTLLCIIAEGAIDNTARQLEQVLMIPSDKEQFRRIRFY